MPSEKILGSAPHNERQHLAEQLIVSTSSSITPTGDAAIVLVPRCDDQTDPVIAHTAALLVQAGITVVCVDVASHTAVERLIEVIDSMQRSRVILIGLLAGGSLATSALVAAAQRPGVATTVVYGSDCGREDEWLPALRSPALFIVGSRDMACRRAYSGVTRRAVAATTVAVVSGTSNSFQEPGAIDEVAGLATAWFAAHLPTRSANTLSRPSVSAP